jgi:hypothetical protein
MQAVYRVATSGATPLLLSRSSIAASLPSSPAVREESGGEGRSPTVSLGTN